MGFSSQERINLNSKVLAASVKDANEVGQWYESFFSNKFVSVGDKVWTAPDVQTLLNYSAHNLTSAQANAAEIPSIINDLSDITSAIRLTPVPGSNGSTYVAFSTYGDLGSSKLDNWIQPQLIPRTDIGFSGYPSIGYAVRLFNGDPNTTGTEIFASDGQTGSGALSTVAWVFDYANGMLLISSDFRSTLTDPYILGFRYIGSTANDGYDSSQTLAEVLLEGNTSNGTDIIIESSDLILDTASILSTGAISIIANTSVNSNGGDTSIISGNSTNANGGNFSINSGSGVQGGSVSVSSGNGTTNNGGSFTVVSGNSSSANGGQLSLNTGSGLVGGNFNITTGVGTSTRAGNITLSVGNSNTNGGTVSISSGPSGASGNGGSFSLNTGLGAGASGNGGSFVIQAGESVGGGTGGSVAINAGGANVNGGPIFITAGSSLANTGGNVTITAGSGPNISGSVNIFAGGAASSPGDITFNTEGSVIANAQFIASGLSYPIADGSAGDVIVTNGAGVLSFTSASLGTHASSHESGGSDEIDGYNLSLLYSPSNYNSPDNDLIGEHIAAIDDALGLAAYAIQVQESIAVDSLGDTSFTLSQSPLDSAAVKMFVNGLKQIYGSDYTIVGTTVTYSGSYELDVTDEVEFWYLVSGTIINAPYSLAVQDEGIDVDTNVNTINFIGSGVVATSSSAGVISVTIDSTGVGDHADTHESGGSDELDGYNLSIDYTPDNYNPPVNDLIGEHIAAIDNALGNIPLVASSPGPINYTVNLGPDLEGSFEDLLFEADGYFDLTFQANKISTRMLWIVATDGYGIIYETCKRIKAITNGSSVTFFSTSDVYGSTDADQDEVPTEIVLDFIVNDLNLTVMLTNNIITEVGINVAWVSQLEHANIPGVPT